jgi:UDP-N-acetylglucosamine 2-epimerase (non-hydrolysing)/GDP/UDP-N,N'-diacetylbacillosamine 2-epimerase (hydrolysing)
MGEEAWRVHDVGLPVLDGKATTPDELREKYGLWPGRPVAVFCMHPVGGIGRAYEACDAVDMASTDLGLQVVAIAPNGDAGADNIEQEFARISSGYRNIHMHGNIPRADYHGLLQIADCVIGNSSAGIKEAPAFGCPCVNIGDRQKGRLRGANVIDVGHDADEIYAAIVRCVTDMPWRAAVRRAPSPYGGAGASRRIATVLGYADLTRRKKVTA